MSSFEDGPCLFCGAPDRRADLDVWPGWIGTSLDQAPRRATGGLFKAWSLDLTHRSACTTCSSTWIEPLESAAAEHIGPLVEGRACVVNGGRPIGAWMTWVTAALDSALGWRHIPDAIRTSIYADPSRAPRGVSVWLGRYAGANPGIDHRVRRLFDLIDAFDPDAFVVTMRVGYLVAQVVASQEDDAFGALGNPARTKTTVAVWPARGARRWPPEEALTDRAFEALAQLKQPL